MTASITRVFLALWLGIFASLSARADWLANIVEFTPPTGWVQSPPDHPEQADGVPTIKFIPPSGRHAEVLLSLFLNNSPKLKVSDAASLKQFNLVSATPYLPTPSARPATADLSIADGVGLYMINEDPSLVGKPLPPGEYRYAMTATLYLAGKFLVHGTVFFDDKNSPDFQQAIQLLQSAKIRPAVLTAIAKENATAPTPAAGPINQADIISRPGLHAVLHLPANRFHPTEMAGSSDPGYFSYLDGRHLILSGWLDQAGHFNGMKSFWAAEKKALETKAGVPVTDESFKLIHGWNTVTYTVSLGDLRQKNLRACRVVGDTWADLHLSISNPEASWKDLESALAEITLSIQVE